MKIFLTGEKGVGKSTCIQEIIKECQISVCGFMTLPFYEENIGPPGSCPSRADIRWKVGRGPT